MSIKPSLASRFRRLATRRSSCAAFVTAALALAIGFGYHRAMRGVMPSSPSLDVRHDAAAIKTSGDAATSLGFRWQQGQGCAYHVAHQTALGAAIGDKSQPSGSITKIEAVLHALVLETSAAEARIGFQFSKVSVTSTDHRSHQQVEEMLGASPVMVTMSATGEMRSITFRDELAEADQDQLRALILGAQIILPASGTPKTWNTEELDANGRWHCEYSRQDGGMIAKRRVSMTPRADSPFTVAVRQSAAAIKLGPFWIESLEASETMSVMFDGKAMNEVITSMHLHCIAEAVETPVTLSNLDARLFTHASRSDTTKYRKPASQSAAENDALEELKQKYAGVSVAQSLHALADALKNARSHADTVAAIDDLADHLRASPQRALELAQMLKDPNLPDGLTSRAMHALELSGATTAESQAALAQIIAHPEDYSPGVVSQAVVAAGGVEQIRAAELTDALRSLATQNEEEFLRDAAVLALGKLGEANPDLGVEMTSALATNLDATSSLEDIRVSLWSLTNGKLSSEQTLQQAGQLLQHSDESVRAAAVEYLATVAPGQQAALIPLLQDSAESVRVATVKAVLSSPQPAAESITAILQIASSGSATESLRGTAVNALAAHAAANSEITTAFQQMLATSLTDSLREQLLQVLATSATKTAQK